MSVKLILIAFAAASSLAMSAIASAQGFRLELIDSAGNGTPKPVFITEADVLRYDADQHRLVLGYDAGRRLRDFSVPKAGRPFAVFAGNDRIYVGRFFDGFTEPEYRGVAVDIASLRKYPPSIVFELDYPPLVPKNPSRDPRNDARLVSAFRNAGLLFHDVWLDATCVKVFGTGKRRQSFVFDFNVVKVVKGRYGKRSVEFELYFDAGGAELRDAVAAGCGSGESLKFRLKFQRQDNETDPYLSYQGFEPID